jgi:hypothetical protein
MSPPRAREASSTARRQSAGVDPTRPAKRNKDVSAMSDEFHWNRRDHLLARLDRMVQSGRLNEREADGLRAAGGADEFNGVMLDIRLRHARARAQSSRSGGQRDRDRRRRSRARRAGRTSADPSERDRPGRTLGWRSPSAESLGEMISRPTRQEPPRSRGSRPRPSTAVEAQLHRGSPPRRGAADR